MPLPELAVPVTAKTAPFERGMRKAKQSARSFGSQIDQIRRGPITGLSSGLSKIGASAVAMVNPIGAAAAAFAGLTAGIAAAGAAVLAFGRHGIKMASSLEQAELKFSVLLRSSERGLKLLKQLNKFSVATPFEPEEVRKSAGALLAFGVEQEKIMPLMRQLADLAGVSGAKIDDLADIYGKSFASGVVQMEEVNRFTDRGIGLFTELGRVTGTSGRELRKLISGGKVGIPELNRAIQNMTSSSGQFFQGAERGSKTLSGLWSTLTGKFDAAAANFGKAVMEVFNLKEGLQATSDIMQAFTMDDFVTQWKTVLVPVREFAKMMGQIADFTGAFRDAFKETLALSRLLVEIKNLPTPEEAFTRTFGATVGSDQSRTTPQVKPRQTVRELTVETPKVNINSDQAGRGADAISRPRENPQLLATAQQIHGSIRTMTNGMASILAALRDIRNAIQESRLQVAR